MLVTTCFCGWFHISHNRIGPQSVLVAICSGGPLLSLSSQIKVVQNILFQNFMKGWQEEEDPATQCKISIEYTVGDNVFPQMFDTPVSALCIQSTSSKVFKMKSKFKSSTGVSQTKAISKCQCVSWFCDWWMWSKLMFSTWTQSAWFHVTWCNFISTDLDKIGKKLQLVCALPLSVF